MINARTPIGEVQLEFASPRISPLAVFKALLVWTCMYGTRQERKAAELIFIEHPELRSA
jgi:hypothetical protein